MKTTITFLALSLLIIGTTLQSAAPATTATSATAQPGSAPKAAEKAVAKPTIKSIFDTEFKNGSTALIAALKKAGYLNDAAALEKAKALVIAKNTKELTRQFKDGSLKGSFSSEMQTAAAPILPTGTFDIGKISELKKHFEK